MAFWNTYRALKTFGLPASSLSSEGGGQNSSTNDEGKGKRNGKKEKENGREKRRNVKKRGMGNGTDEWG